jgi:hypothetical protein
LSSDSLEIEKDRFILFSLITGQAKTKRPCSIVLQVVVIKHLKTFALFQSGNAKQRFSFNNFLRLPRNTKVTKARTQQTPIKTGTGVKDSRVQVKFKKNLINLNTVMLIFLEVFGNN